MENDKKYLYGKDGNNKYNYVEYAPKHYYIEQKYVQTICDMNEKSKIPDNVKKGYKIIKDDTIDFSNDNVILYNDNLYALLNYPSNCIDLIYMDPPFNSNRDYNKIYKNIKDKYSGDNAQTKVFEDTWQWNIDAENTFNRLKGMSNLSNMLYGMNYILGKSGTFAYILYMSERLLEMHRVLKSTGSIYLHCDTTASYWLRIVMDNIFGQKNFQNEIIWRYGLGGSSSKRWQRKHDNILFYTKSSTFIFNPIMVPSTSNKMKGELKKDDDVWNFVNDNLIIEIPTINNMAKERIGYETQKPMELIEKIILASSNRGDKILDPFCGGGTTISAAEKLGRKWSTIDVTTKSTDITIKRIRREFPYVKFKEYGLPIDVESAKRMWEKDKYEFQTWVIESLLNGRVNVEGPDGGIDGWISFEIKENDKLERKDVIVEVKGGNIGEPHIKKLIGAIDSNKKNNVVGGIFITLEENKQVIKEMKKTISGIKESDKKYSYFGHGYDSIQVRTLRELLDNDIEKIIDFPWENQVKSNQNIQVVKTDSSYESKVSKMILNTDEL